MSYPQLNVRDGSHDPWPALEENRWVDPYRHALAVDVVRDLAARIGVERPAILDLGCGDGVTLGFLHEAGFTDLVGVDHSEVGVARAQRQAPSARLVVADLTGPVVLGPCDVAICTEVLEHLPTDRDVALVMLLLFASVRAGGWGYISIPDDSICVVDDDHRRLFAPSDVTALLVAAGFIEVERVEYHYSDAYPWPWMMAVGRKP